MNELSKPKIFISHAREDGATAQLLRGYLLARGISVWTDDQIVAGDDWADAVEQALESSEIIVLLLSPAFLNSSICFYEAGLALGKQRDKKGTVLPVLIGDVDPASVPFQLRRIQMLDARRLDGEHLLHKLDEVLAAA